MAAPRKRLALIAAILGSFVAGLDATVVNVALPAIEEDLVDVQGEPVDLGGYYRPDPAKAAAVMRPSTRFEAALAKVSAQHRRLTGTGVSAPRPSDLTRF